MLPFAAEEVAARDWTARSGVQGCSDSRGGGSRQRACQCRPQACQCRPWLCARAAPGLDQKMVVQRCDRLLACSVGKAAAGLPLTGTHETSTGTAEQAGAVACSGWGCDALCCPHHHHHRARLHAYLNRNPAPLPPLPHCLLRRPQGGRRRQDPVRPRVDRHVPPRGVR